MKLYKKYKIIYKKAEVAEGFFFAAMFIFSSFNFYLKGNKVYKETRKEMSAGGIKNPRGFFKAST